MQMNWNLLINYLKEPNIEHVGLCFVINYHSFAFIARRRSRDYLEGCYELPQGILNPGEEVVSGAKRILKEFYNVDLKAISRYLGEFTYTSGNNRHTQMFCFVVTVQNPKKIQIKRNDHGAWMQLSEIRSWPIITHFEEFLVKFWLGEGFDPNLSRALIEQSKREDIWRYKVRVLSFKKGEVLLLKRARRHRILPLYYELPGKEITYNQDIDSAIIACMTEQTGWAPVDVTGFIGCYDYKSESSKGVVVREFIYSAIAQDQPVKLSEHAYSAWVKEVKPKNTLCTPSAAFALEQFAEKSFVNVPDKVEILPAVYSKISDLMTDERKRYLDAMTKLETTGEIDVEALRGNELIKEAFPPEMQKKLGF